MNAHNTRSLDSTDGMMSVAQLRLVYVWRLYSSRKCVYIMTVQLGTLLSASKRTSTYNDKMNKKKKPKKKTKKNNNRTKAMRNTPRQLQSPTTIERITHKKPNESEWVFLRERVEEYDGQNWFRTKIMRIDVVCCRLPPLFCRCCSYRHCRRI